MTGINTKRLLKREKALIAEELTLVKERLLRGYERVTKGDRFGLTDLMHFHGRYIGLDRLGLIPEEERIDQQIIGDCHTLLVRHYTILGREQRVEEKVSL